MPLNVFGYEIGIAKRIPKNGSPARSLTTEADIAAGKLPTPVLGETAAPAAGPRPNPGPLPVVDVSADAQDLRHQPLRFQFPYAVNQVWTPRRNALTPFAVLRNIAEVSDLTRICIETRKDQMCSLGWDIAPRDKKAVADTNAANIQKARTFFRSPDRRRSFSTWLRMAIEEILVIDALSVYRRKTRGGEICALEIKDGTTFLPLIGPDGDTPLPPQVAFRQVINGMPIAGGDCTTDQLYYRPRTVRAHTPYGLSPTEAVLLTITAALNRQMFNLAYYTEGNVPEGLLSAPKDFSTKQLVEFQEYLDDFLAGNLAQRRRLKVVHNGSELQQFKDADFATQWDEWLLKVHAAAFAVPPQEIGFTGDVNKATGQMQENIVYRRGVKPMSLYFKDLFDDVLALDLGMPDLEWVWTGGEVEDKLQQAQADQIYVDMGKTSVDELRIRDGQEPIGLGPYISTAMGPVFVEELLAGPPDDDPDTTNVEPGKDKEPAPTPEEKVSEAAMADLRKWRAIAVKAVKAKKPIREFHSDAIPLELYARVDAALEKATSVNAVVAAFDTSLLIHEEVQKAAESRTLTKRELRAAKAMKRLMTTHFKKQGKALAGHLKDKLS